MQKSISKQQIKSIHGLLNDLGLMEEKKMFIDQYTKGRSESTKEMWYAEAAELKQFLFDEKTRLAKPMRGKIIHYCCNMGMTGTTSAPNMIRIHDFVKNIGSRNPKKRNLWQLTLSELSEVTTQVEVIYRKQLVK